MIAAKIGVPVVSDFRPADMAAGGKGAPLVPFLDYVLYRHRRYGRIVQNLGGIGNLTAIPPRAQPERRGRLRHRSGQHGDRRRRPQHLFDKPFDRNGRLAARGEPIERGAARIAAPSVLPSEASQDCRPRTVWPRVRARVSSPLPSRRRERHRRHRNRAHGAIDRHRGSQVRVTAAGK